MFFRDITSSNKLLDELPNYTSIPQVRKKRRQEGVSLYISPSVEFKIRNKLGINSDEEFNRTSFPERKNTIFNVLDRKPKGQIERFNKFLRKRLSQQKDSHKQFHIPGNFNLNFLDYEIRKKLPE